MTESERPDSRFRRLVNLYGPEGARTIVEAVQRLIAVFADEQILDASDVGERLGVSKRTLRRMVSCGEIPAPIQVNGKRVGWRKSDFERWLAARPTIGQH